MPWVPATPTGRPRLPRRSSGGKRVKVLARRERGTRLGERSGSSRPRPPGPGPQASGLRCRSTPPAGWGSWRRRIHPWPRERDRFGTGRRGERERKRAAGRASPPPWHATIWSSASWMARSNDVGRWHWTHCAVFLGSRAMNCSSTTRSTIWSTSSPPANSHLRHASRSCWAITKGRLFSPSSSDRKRWRCCSGFKPTRWRMALLRSL